MGVVGHTSYCVALVLTVSYYVHYMYICRYLVKYHFNLMCHVVMSDLTMTLRQSHDARRTLVGHIYFSAEKGQFIFVSFSLYFVVPYVYKDCRREIRIN